MRSKHRIFDLVLYIGRAYFFNHLLRFLSSCLNYIYAFWSIGAFAFYPRYFSLFHIRDYLVYFHIFPNSEFPLALSLLSYGIRPISRKFVSQDEPIHYTGQPPSNKFSPRVNTLRTTRPCKWQIPGKAELGQMLLFSLTRLVGLHTHDDDDAFSGAETRSRVDICG